MDLSYPEPAAPASALKGETISEEPGRSQRAIARRSAETRATVPDLEFSVDVDADPVLELTRREGCSTTTVLVRACAVALREFPRVNGAYRDGHFERYSRVNVAVVIQTEDAQPAATVLDADTKSLPELDEELSRLRERAASGELTSPEQAGATFALSDLGHLGVRRAAGLITPPQAAALTAGAIRAVPVVRDGVVAPGHELVLTLTCDHRILFGAHAAGFLTRVAELLETAG
ncbi:MAG: 2-oxo acid dehydrogenase subunit E2 [Solirubrobacteraceae bacterium]